MTLTAKVCNGSDITAYCRAIPPVTGLTTKMSATATALNQDGTALVAGSVLTGTITISSTNFTNVNHVTVQATYRDPGQPTPTVHNLARLTGANTFAWDTNTVQAQSGILLEGARLFPGW